MNANEFYIGWQPRAPKSFKKQIRKAILFLAVMIPIAAMILSVLQKKFSSAVFEFGTLTEVKGIYFQKPVPMLKVSSGRDLFGNATYVTIPLVGFGKFGASGIMSELEQQNGTVLDKKEITLKGTLLYSDGKVLIQVDGNDRPLVHIGNEANANLFPKTEDLGKQTFQGEIVDPKCYFGVMKPGQGKPHKDCAIRCILGGIPPVLRVTNDAAANYYLVLDENGNPMNERVKNFVAEPTSLQARAVQYDDWVILYVDTKDIKHISYLDMAGLQAESCAANYP